MHDTISRRLPFDIGKYNLSRVIAINDNRGSVIAHINCAFGDKAAIEYADRIVRAFNAHAALLTALDTIASGNTDPDQMVEIARAAVIAVRS